MAENNDRHYQVLSLEPTASPQEIYQAYRDLSRVWDPQRFGHSPRLELLAEAKLKEIVEAYHALLPAGIPEGAGDAEPRPTAQARPIADRYRPQELPKEAAPPPISALLPSTGERPTEAVAAEPQVPVAAEAQVPVVRAQEVSGNPGGTPAQMPAPRSRALRFAVAGVAVLLVLAAVLFVYEAFWGRPQRRENAHAAQSVAAPRFAVQTPEPLAQQPEPADLGPSTPAKAGAAAPNRARRATPQPQEPLRQLATGTELMRPEGRKGAGRFRIVNRSGHDTVARVASQAAPETALRLVYIQSGSEVTIRDIGTGVYFVAFSAGPPASKPRAFGQRFGPFQFVQIQSAGGYQSDQYEIVLKPAR